MTLRIRDPYLRAGLVMWLMAAFLLIASHCQERAAQAVILGAATVADWHSGAGLHELNPILGQSRVRQAVIMTVSSGVAWYGAGRIKRRWVRWTVIGAVSGMHLALAIHNRRKR